VQVPLVLPIVIVAEPLPLPLHIPLVVIATAKPELAVAATPKVLLYAALAGAGVVTVIVWSDLGAVAVVSLVTSGAAL
jgi:hypothetical protein